jgi:LEA14-like dessication related protein
MRKLLLGLVASLALSGCAAVPINLKTPDVSVVGIRGLEANFFEQRLEVRMRVKNPNSVELPVNGLDVDVELADEPFAHGVSAREFVVPANGEAEFDMIVTANAANAILKIVGDGGQRGEVGYKLKGKLSTHLGLLRTIPFEETGTLPVADMLGKKRKKD